MAMKSSLLNDIILNWEKVQCTLNGASAGFSFLKRCPQVQQTMPWLQYNKHFLHCTLGSVSNNSNSSTLPMSFIFLDFSLNGLWVLFCCRYCWRACRWKRFTICFTSSRTREFSACFRTQCGNPDILKSISTSFNIERSDCAHTTGLSVLSWFDSSSKLKFLLSREERVSISWERCALSERTTGLPVLSWFGFGFGWVGWESCLSSNFPFWVSSNIWTQFLHPIMFQGNLWRRPRWRIYFLVFDFSSFHPNNFRDTISWECFMKNDGVRSCLIELQSFLQS